MMIFTIFKIEKSLHGESQFTGDAALNTASLHEMEDNLLLIAAGMFFYHRGGMIALAVYV